MRLLVSFLFAGLLVPAIVCGQDLADVEEEINRKEKNDKFLDYFNLQPKAQRDFTSVTAFEFYEGLIISDIIIKVFDRHAESLTNATDLYCTEITEDKKTKFNTALVSKQLLFELGDVIDPNILSDTERFIRENTIYRDAMVRVVPIDSTGYADVYVFIQDNRHWKINFEASPTGIVMGASAFDFLGVAQELTFTGGGLFAPKNPYTIQGKYGVNNIRNSKINAKFIFTKQNIWQEPAISISRDFVAYNTKWAGKADVSLSAFKVSENPNNNRSLDISPEYNLRFIKQDYWLAKSMPMPRFNDINKASRFIIAGRAFLKQHITKPDPDKFPVQNYVDQQFYLGSMGVGTRDWYGFEELYQFRQFDYVPKGFNIALLGGFERNEFLGDRWYSGLTTNYAKLFERFGYLRGELRYGGFIRDGEYEQITTQINTQYFTNRAKVGKLDFRQFINTSTTLSYNRPATEFYSISNGVQGLNSNELFGTKSMILNFESVFYTPITWWQSRGSFFLFADLGYVTQNDRESIFDNVLHQGYGAGIRFQHLPTTIWFMEISMGYYPNAHVVNSPVIGFNVSMTPTRGINHNNLFSAGVLSDIY